MNLQPITLVFEASDEGHLRFFPKGRIAESMCRLTGRPYMTNQQIEILRSEMGFNVRTEVGERV